METLLPKIDLYHLLVFYYVCNEKSISAAADKLFLSQPTITGHMKSLEESVQTKLFKIYKKKLVLTQTGEGLYHYAREVYKQLIAADRFIEISKESNLRIGVSSLLVLPVARSINNLSKQFNNSINIQVRSGLSYTLVRDLADSKIDVAIVPTLDFGDKSLSYIRIANGVKLTCYASASNPIFKKASFSWADIVKYPLVIGTGDSPIREIVTNKLLSEGVKTSPLFDLAGDNFEFFKTIVKNGDSISFALYEDIREDVERGVLKVIKASGELCTDIDAVTPHSHFSTHLVQSFISCAKAIWKESS
jgi:DNA-binding transcriptional LysR family regulator